MNARAVYGWRPSSPIRAARSTWKFGARSRIRDTRARSSAAQPTWAPMNVVRGWRTTTASRPSISSSNGGKPSRSGRPGGRVGQKCQSGWACSSSQRSLRASSGSKKATGSATWIVTGTPSSPAAAHSGSRRGSSTGTRRPDVSRARSPSSFQTLRPLAPAATPSRSRPGLHLPEGGVLRPAVVVQPREHGHASGQRHLPALDLAAQPVAPAAIEVDDPLDARRVHRARQLGSPCAWTSPRRTAPRGGCGHRSPGSAAAAPRARARAVPGAAGSPPAQAARTWAQPLSPVRAMPRTKYFCAITNSVIIGSRLTIAPAIISGHLPTNWPWKNASPTVVVYWSRSRR